MSLNYYKNKKTGEIKRTLRDHPEPKEDWEIILRAPDSKFMVKVNAATNKSKIKDLDPILKARSRNHSRDNDLASNITVNRESGSNESMINQNFLNENGQKRKKIDDK